MLEIKNLNLNSKKEINSKLTVDPITNNCDYNVSFKLHDSIVGIYCQDREVVKKFLKYVAGINKTSSIYFDNKPVFNNLKNRMYLDFSNNYLSALNVEDIYINILESFSKTIDKDKFKKISKDLDIRGDAIIEKSYIFNPQGNTSLNFCLLSSLNYPIAIINNPTINVNNIKIINYMADYYKHNYRYLIFGLNNLYTLNNILDYIIIFDDFNNTRILSNSDEVIVCDYYEDDLLDTFKMFKSQDHKRLILFNGLTKDDYKLLKQRKLSYYKIRLDEVERYL